MASDMGRHGAGKGSSEAENTRREGPGGGSILDSLLSTGKCETTYYSPTMDTGVDAQSQTSEVVYSADKGSAKSAK